MYNVAQGLRMSSAKFQSLFGSKPMNIKNFKEELHNLSFTMVEKFNISWDSFLFHGKDLFRELKETQNFSDVTLVSDDQYQFKAHKFILSYCSAVFRSILSGNPQNSTIYLRGIHHEVLKSILEFIYLGETTFHKERMDDFISTAKDLNIKEIGEDVDDISGKKSDDVQHQESDKDEKLNIDENQQEFVNKQVLKQDAATKIDDMQHQESFNDEKLYIDESFPVLKQVAAIKLRSCINANIVLKDLLTKEAWITT